MFRTSRKQSFAVSLFAVSVLLGGMLTIQFSISHRPHTAITGNYLELRSELDHEVARGEVLSKDIASIENQLSTFQAASGNRQATLKAMNAELQTLQVEAGLTPYSGPGILITIKDDPFLPPSSLNPTVTDTELQYIVNLLFANGAKAISINGQRLVTNTSIRLVGGLNDPVGVMQVNANPIEMPYTIAAVGDISRMTAVLQVDNLSFTFRQMQKDFMVTSMAKGMTLPAYQGPLPGRFAKPEVSAK